LLAHDGSAGHDKQWEWRMTRAEIKAEKKAMQARAAVAVLAQLAAKNEVKNQIRAQGLRVHDFTAKEITLRAEAWLAAHPEMIVEARAKAVRLGYC
jgi:hypothetical protein